VQPEPPRLVRLATSTREFGKTFGGLVTTVLVITVVAFVLLSCEGKAPEASSLADTSSSSVGVDSGRETAETLFVTRKAPLYNGPSESSGRFWFSRRAKKPVTLLKGEAVTVLARSGDWVEVDQFGKTAWVQATNVGNRSLAEESDVRSERMRTFNQLESEAWPGLYDGARDQGQVLTIFVRDRWNYMSKDMREAFVQKTMTLYFGMGAVRHIPEKLEAYTVEVKHDESGRVVARWGSILGFRDLTGS